MLIVVKTNDATLDCNQRASRCYEIERNARTTGVIYLKNDEEFITSLDNGELVKHPPRISETMVELK